MPPWRERAWGNAFPPEQRGEFIQSLDEFFQRIHDAAKSGRDSAANLYLEPGNRWNPMIDAISSYINGAETDRVSILDFDAYEDTNRNWRIRRGYGALMAAYGASLPLAFNCAVDADRSFRQAPAHRDLAGHAHAPTRSSSPCRPI